MGRDTSQSSSAIQITSSHFSEGVTTVTLAMALFMADTHESEDVIAVEANLRKPSFADVLGLKSTGSLVGVFEKSCSLSSAIDRVPGYNFFVLPAGTVGDRQDHDALLERLRDVLVELRKFYRYILVDTPPVIPFGDASIVCPMVDGTFFVVASNFNRSEVVEHAIDTLKDADARMLGILLNKREHYIPRWLYRLV